MVTVALPSASALACAQHLLAASYQYPSWQRPAPLSSVAPHDALVSLSWKEYSSLPWQVSTCFSLKTTPLSMQVNSPESSTTWKVVPLGTSTFVYGIFLTQSSGICSAFSAAQLEV